MVYLSGLVYLFRVFRAFRGSNFGMPRKDNATHKAERYQARQAGIL